MARRKPAAPQEPTGWVESPKDVDAITVAMGGNSVMFDASPFHGYAAEQIRKGSTGVFPHLAERELFGSFLPSFMQYRGTCVGQATARAIQDSYFYSVRTRGLVGRLTQVAVAPLYGFGRIDIGKGRIKGDGCVGAWAIYGAVKIGPVARKKIGQYDLSKQNGDETYAVAWGNNGVPQEVKQAVEGELVAYRCKSADDIADAAWAGFGLQFCGRYTYSSKDANGIARLNKPSNHCTEALGACLSVGGNILIGGQQSWGDKTPAGPNVLTYKGGKVDMRPGQSFVPVEDYYNVARQSGEIWAIQVKLGFRPKDASELIT